MYNAATRSYRKTQRYNTVNWLTIQLTSLKENLLSKKLANGLKSVNPKTPKFYISPKIHKENNPERPVINSINCHTSEISHFVDFLSPNQKEICNILTLHRRHFYGLD